MLRLARALLVLVASGTASCNRMADAPVCRPRRRRAKARPAAVPRAQARTPAAQHARRAGDARRTGWARTKKARLDEVLLDERALAVQDEALRSGPDGSAARWSTCATRRASRSAKRRSASALDDLSSELLATGQYASTRGGCEADLASAPAAFVEQRELRVALAPIDLRCVPFAEPIRSSRGSEGFDRNRCSQARAQEPIELLGKVGDGFRLARTTQRIRLRRSRRTAVARGAGRADAALPAPAHAQPGRAALARRAAAPGGHLTAHRRRRARGLIATRDGVVQRPHPEPSEALSHPQARSPGAPSSREAFRYVGSPYGWGDEGGGRDCSRFVLDVLASLRPQLPRTSAHQAQRAATWSTCRESTSETERLALLDEAARARRGAGALSRAHHVLPGSRQRACRACCTRSPSTSRPARGRRDAVRGGPRDRHRPDARQGHQPPLVPRAHHAPHRVRQARPATSCSRSRTFAHRSRRPTLDPEGAATTARTSRCFARRATPTRARPLRVIAVSRDDVRPASVWLVVPQGALLAPEVHDLGVGPYTRWVEQPDPEPGKWRALLADGDSVLACEEVSRRAARKAASRSPQRSRRPACVDDDAALGARHRGAVRRVRRAAVLAPGRATCAAGRRCSELLQKPERNLLFDHRGHRRRHPLDAGARLRRPTLLVARVLRLEGGPAVRLSPVLARSRRARRRTATRSLPPTRSRSSAKRRAQGLRRFWRKLADGVHSASGRTLPDDQADRPVSGPAHAARAHARQRVHRPVRSHDRGRQVAAAGPRRRRAC